MSVIAEVRYIWGWIKLFFNVTFKFIPLKLRLFSVLLQMDMNSIILHTQKHTLLHLWTLDVTDGSTTQQDAWMLPSFMHLLYCRTYSNFPPPPQWHNSPFWARAPSLPWLHDHTRTHHTLVGLLSTSDRPDAKTPMWQHTTLTRGRHPCRGWDWNSQSQQANGGRPTPYTACGHQDRPECLNTLHIHVAQLV
jgi:hypothetical protein